MAHDAELANRIREMLAAETGVDEKRMFGGLAFLIGGHIAVAVSGRGGVMLRCDRDDTEQFVAAEHVERMVMRGRELDGWLRIDAAGIDSDHDLGRWLRVGVDSARRVPPK